MFQNRKNTILTLLFIYSFSSCAADIPLLQLDDESIAQEKLRIISDFTKRDYLAKVSYTALAGGTLLCAYKWGLFDYFRSKNPAELPALPEDTQVTHDQLLPMVAALIQHTKDQSKEIKLLKAQNLEGKSHWFIEGIKYVGLTGFSILAGILVQSAYL